MSDIVGGGIFKGEGNEQVSITFNGRLDAAQWAAFVECVKKCAGTFKVTVEEVKKQP